MFKELYFKYKWYLLFTVPMSLLLGIASMSVIAVISDALGNGLEDMKYGRDAFFIAIFVLFFAGLVNEVFRARLYAGVIYDLQARMIDRVSATNLQQIEKTGLPKVIATLTQDVETAVKFFHVLPELVVNIAIILCGVSYMAYLSIDLLLLVSVSILVTGLLITALILSTKPDRVCLRDATDQIIFQYQSLVNGAKELTLNTPRRTHFRQNLFGILGDVRRRGKRVLYVLALMETTGQLAVFAILGSVIFIAIEYVPVTAETIVGYVITLLFLLEPIEVLVTRSDDLMEARVAFNKIDSLNLAENKFEEVSTVDITTFKATSSSVLSLQQVGYEYENEQDGKITSFHLGSISVDFRPGEVTLIIGGNGSGKSTLLKIICGLYQAQSGSIKYGGRVLTDQNLQAFRNNFSIIMPDFCLFKDVLDGQGEFCADEAINKKLESLKLASVVSGSNSRLSSLDLSQGQRKRLALLQASFEDKPIILLDEWAADQDPAYKKIFYQEIVPSLKASKKIVILVSHDERYFDAADRVLKLDEGTLIELKLKKAV